MADVKKPTVRMRLDAWTYADYLIFIAAMRELNFDMAFELADKIIESWSYPTPFKPGAIQDLNSIEAMRVLRTVLDALNKFVEDIATDDVVLDFSKWPLKRFLEFNKYRENGNARKVMEMVREVAMVEGLNEDDEPSMSQGAVMVKAVTDAMGLVLQGKN